MCIALRILLHSSSRWPCFRPGVRRCGAFKLWYNQPGTCNVCTYVRAYTKIYTHFKPTASWQLARNCRNVARQLATVTLPAHGRENNMSDMRFDIESVWIASCNKSHWEYFCSRRHLSWVELHHQHRIQLFHLFISFEPDFRRSRVSISAKFIGLKDQQNHCTRCSDILLISKD